MKNEKRFHITHDLLLLLIKCDSPLCLNDKFVNKKGNRFRLPFDVPMKRHAY